MNNNTLCDEFIIGNHRYVVDYVDGVIDVDKSIFTDATSQSRAYALKSLFDKMRLAQGRAMTIVFIPTYSCNMHCSYCYEGNTLKNDTTIEEWKAGVIRDFVEEMIRTKGINKLILYIMGGEPLQSQNEQLIVDFIEIMREIKIPIDVTCVTNGAKVSELVAMFVNTFQITLDGDKATHDFRRRNLDGTSSFESAICAIERYLELGRRVVVRSNIDASNVESILDLYTTLRSIKDRHPTALSCYLYPISENGCDQSACYLPEPEIVESIYSIFNRYPHLSTIFAVPFHGYRFISAAVSGISPRPVKHFCAASSNQFVFDTSCTVKTCWWGNAIDSFVVGCIDKDGVVIDERALTKWKCRSALNIDKCSTCKYILVCGGGCAYKAEKKHGDFSEGSCSDFPKLFTTYLKYHDGQRY